MSLSPQQQAVLATASPQAVSDSARKILGQITNQRWLAPRNRYRVATIKSIEEDHRCGNVNSRDLTDYVAASAPLHCCDGWAYLGRAMGCHLHGDSDSARHLAYYAELRATMALLASQGVAVLNRHHFVIDENGSTTLLKQGGTHEVAWEVLEAWSGLSHASDLLGDVLKPAGHSLTHWINAIPNGASWRPISTDWMLKLGLDLRLLSNDRNARNEASYRPTRLNQRASLTSVEAVTAAREIWSLLEPAQSITFGEIDRHLLRLTLETAFESIEGASSVRNKQKFAEVVSSVVASKFAGAEATLWERFLRRELDPCDPGIIDLVRLKQKSPAPLDADIQVRCSDHHLSVMARALLLLRVASGGTRRMIVDAGIDFDQLAFWWHDYGTERGLWKKAPAAAHITDGWADTEAVLTDIDEWLDRAPPRTYRDLLTELPSTMTSLTNLEMVGLWSLAS